MRLAAAALVVMVGCAPNERECADVRTAVETWNPEPRRYRDADDAKSNELAVAVLGCTESAREHDCAAVRPILEGPFALPPSEGEIGIYDTGILDRLKTMPYRDAAVRDATLALLKHVGWTVYTPYSAGAEPSGARERLAKLCGVPIATGVR